MRTLTFPRTLIIAVPAAVLACASGSVAPPPVPPGYELLRCRPGNIGFADAELDETGGTLTARHHRFFVPRGAVNGRVRFTMRERRTGYAGVDITPPGTEFNPPAQLTLSYAHCENLPPNLQPTVVEVEHGGTEIVGPPIRGEVDSQARTITVSIQHLSGYLVGTNSTEPALIPPPPPPP